MTIIVINENFFSRLYKTLELAYIQYQTINILSVAGRDDIEDDLHNTTVNININRS